MLGASEIEAVRRQRPRIVVVGVEAGGDREHAFGVLGGQREDRHRVERTARRHDAARRQRAAAGLVADQVVERGGHAAGAGGVGAEREARQPERDRDRRSGARAARNERGVEGVAARAVGRAGAVQARGELVEVGLADRDRAGVDQPLHDRGVPLRRVGERRAAGGGRQAGEVDVVLDREGNAVERQARRIPAFQVSCVDAEGARVEPADPDVVRIRVRHAGEQVFHEFERRELAGLVQAAQGGDVERCVHCPFLTRPPAPAGPARRRPARPRGRTPCKRGRRTAPARRTPSSSIRR